MFNDHVIISDAIISIETAVRSTNYIFFFFASYYQTGCPLREDLGEALSGTQLKPGSAFKDPSLHDVAATRNERGQRTDGAALGCGAVMVQRQG